MDRRLFMGILGGMGFAGANGMATPAADKRTRFYVLENYYLKNGTQAARLHEWFGNALLPALDGIHRGPKIFLEAFIAPHIPQVAALYGFSSLEEMRDLQARLGADTAVAKAVEKWGSGPEPAFESQTTTLLEAAGYSPEIQPEQRAKPRIFELRTYHSPTWAQLRALHERFAGPEIPIFHRAGIHPVLYASTLIGANMPSLTYLIPFDNLAAREKAWEAFLADPEWIKVRRESVERHGQVASVIQISLFRAAPYSPLR